MFWSAIVVVINIITLDSSSNFWLRGSLMQKWNFNFKNGIIIIG